MPAASHLPSSNSVRVCLSCAYRVSILCLSCVYRVSIGVPLLQTAVYLQVCLAYSRL